MSRIEQVMRELSDLRDFYLRVQCRNSEQSSIRQTVFVEEQPAEYNQPKAAESKTKH